MNIHVLIVFFPLPFLGPLKAENTEQWGMWGSMRNHTKLVWYWGVWHTHTKLISSLRSSHFFATRQNHTGFLWWLGRNRGKSYDFDGFWIALKLITEVVLDIRILFESCLVRFSCVFGCEPRRYQDSPSNVVSLVTH